MLLKNIIQLVVNDKVVESYETEEGCKVKMEVKTKRANRSLFRGEIHSVDVMPQPIKFGEMEIEKAYFEIRRMIGDTPVEFIKKEDGLLYVFNRGYLKISYHAMKVVSNMRFVKVPDEEPFNFELD